MATLNSNLTITAVPVTISYVGGHAIDVSNPVAVAKIERGSASVLANLELARIQFEARNSTNTLVISQTLTPSSDGTVALSLSGLAAGNYTLQYTVVGGYFSSATPGVSVDISLGNCLNVSLATDNGRGDCGTLSGAIGIVNNYTAGDLSPIVISLTGTSVPTITVQGALPVINNTAGRRIILNGGCTTAAGGTSGGLGVPGVILLATAQGLGDGLKLGSNVTVQGLRVSGFSGYGVTMAGTNNSLKCSWIGRANPSEPASYANGGGVKLTGGSTNHLGTLGQTQSGNLINGNTGLSILVTQGTVSLHYTWVGLQSDGLGLLKNSGGGLKVLGSGHLTFGLGNRIHN